MRWAKTRLAMNSSSTPAETKTLDAIATLTFIGCVAQTMRMIIVTMRDMQKPKSMPEMRNL